MIRFQVAPPATSGCPSTLLALWESRDGAAATVPLARAGRGQGYVAGHWPRLLRPYWVPRVPRYQGYQGYQGYQESGSGMGVSGSLPDLPDSTQALSPTSTGK